MKIKAYLPHFIAVVIFLAISLLYFIKPISEGKKINLPDITHHTGISQEVRDFKKQTGEETYWTNSLFGGMPTYLVSRVQAPKPFTFLNKVLNLNNARPISFIFLSLLGFYIALLAFRVNPWLSIIGAIAYAFSSYFLIIIVAGHAAKATALGYLPAIIGGAHLAFTNRKMLGGLIFAFFLTLQIQINHPQVTYYTFIIIGIDALVLFIYRIKEKQLKDFLLASGLLALFTILSIGVNMSFLSTILEYQDYSTRGKSELVVDKDNQTTGLDLDYATAWSYGIGETFTLLIPNFNGGASAGKLPENSETYKLFKKYQGKAYARKAIKSQPTYWGDQTFVAGPVYAGAIIIFLAIFSLFIIDRKYVWWLVSATLLSFILSWGKNIPNITKFLFEYVPMLNKFRAVSMGLVIAEFTLPLMAILSLNKIFKNEIQKEQAIKALKYATMITGGLLVFFLVFAKGLFDFSALSDQRYLSQQGGEVFVDALESDRLMLFRRDTLRSLVFILLSGSVVFLYIQQKLKMNYALVGMGLLILVDLWSVDKRYLNDDNFISKKQAKTPFVATQADKFILNDKSLDYRVLNLSVSPFNDASTSYFHKSIGGYHGAKMQRYQELISYPITNEMQQIYSAFQSQDFNVISKALTRLNVLNMLNTKYIIYNGQAQPILNNAAFGNAWMVSNIKWVEDANAEMDALEQTDLKNVAIVDERFREDLSTNGLKVDSTARIDLLEYAPNHLVYKSSSKENQIAVFSEIYYPHGWKVTLDGEEVSYGRANYVLRAMNIPAGDHTIEFIFDPEVVHKGKMVGFISTLLLLLTALGAIGYQIKKNKAIVAVEQ